jgi:adenine-specific DNA-methyltransferase
LLFQLAASEWETPSVASNRMRSIAQSLCRRPSNFLLLGTHNYDQLMLVNPRKSFDAQMNLRVGIRKLLIDRTKPTHYDRDRLEAIAAHKLDPKALYNRQCEAFDVEKLTKEFYKGYKEVFEQVQRVILEHNPHPYFDDLGRLHQFSQRLLGRLMFLYFLQKKGFLAGDRDFLRNQYKRVSPDPSDTDFYAGLLEDLFFNTLNHERPNHESPWGKIPYLNGGLFEKDYGGHPDAGGWITPETITLPNSLFDTGEKSILKFFGNYNFTVSENIEGDEDVAVDPEMLGKVFENMLAADERGQSGTFYTPRGIVQFMCVESLSRYLADESGMDLDAVRKLTEYTAELPDAEVNKLLTKDQAKRLKQALGSVKVCDPAVGSGAFPMGMMQVILTVRQAIARREGMTVQRGSLTLCEWKREIIANNLYGVDIKPEAVEIAKLRMWLSMVVDIPTMDDIEPLPNLDYKLMSGNSLISRIYGEQMIPEPMLNKQLKLAVTPTQAAIDALSVLQKRYFAASVDERKVLRDEILETQKQVFRIEIAYRREQWDIKQRKLHADIQRLGGRLSIVQTKEQARITTKSKELDQIEAEVDLGTRSLDFFQWHLHFSEVFREKGGFDIVLGNPPYVRQEQITALKPALKLEHECYTGTADLFVYFFERGFRLLKPNGNLTYICSNKYMRSGYGEKLRKLLGSEGSIQHLIDFGDAPVFEAIAYPSILQVARTAPKENQVRSLTWDASQSVDKFASVFHTNSTLVSQKEFSPDSWRLEPPATSRLMEKLKAAGTPLGEYVGGRFYRGILTGFNEAFVVDRATHDRLIVEHPSSAEVLKPFLRGKNVKRWRLISTDQYLIKIESSDNRKHPWTGCLEREAERIFAQTYPAIHARFNAFRSSLIERDDQGKYFWELRSCKYWDDFEKTKIIYPDIYEHQSFTVDTSGFYSGNTCYFIPAHQLWLCGFLNSWIVEWLYSRLSNKVRGGYLRAFTDCMKQIPVPEASSNDQNAISALVQKCLNAKGQNVAHWEAEINDRVAHLYGLTAAEIVQISEG